MELVNKDISASTKRERGFPVIDRNPNFSKVVRNFNSLDYFYMISIAGVAVPFFVGVAVNPRSRIKPGIREIAMVSGTGLLFGFKFVFENSAERLRGILPNHNEVARLNKGEMENINTDITASTKRGYPVISNAHITLNSLFVSTMAALMTAKGIKPGFRISSLVTPSLVFGATYAPVNFACRLIAILAKDDEINTEYPVIDGKPDFSKVIGNFNMLDYFRMPASTGFSVIAGYHFGMNRNLVTIGLLGLVFGFGYSYMDSTGRLMGVFPNDHEVARFNKK